MWRILSSLRLPVSSVIVLTLSSAMLMSFVAFSGLRIYQLSLDDPYNNPYTDWSTAFLILFLVLWIAALIAFLWLADQLGQWATRAAAVMISLGALPIGLLAYTILRHIT